MFLAIPRAVDYAHLRQSALYTQGVLVRRMLIVPALLWALLVGGTIAWGLYAVALSPRAVIVVPAVAATTVAAVMFAFAPRIFKGLYFSATAQFRPTVEHLSDALATLTDRAAVCDALEEHVTRLLRAIATANAPRSKATGSSTLDEVIDAILALDLPDKFDAVTAGLIDAAVRRADGNKSAAARMLGLHRKVIERRLERKSDPQIDRDPDE